jgi:hypothetical protein
MSQTIRQGRAEVWSSPTIPATTHAARSGKTLGLPVRPQVQNTLVDAVTAVFLPPQIRSRQATFIAGRQLGAGRSANAVVISGSPSDARDGLRACETMGAGRRLPAVGPPQVARIRFHGAGIAAQPRRSCLPPTGASDVPIRGATAGSRSACDGAVI